MRKLLENYISRLSTQQCDGVNEPIAAPLMGYIPNWQFNHECMEVRLSTFGGIFYGKAGECFFRGPAGEEKIPHANFYEILGEVESALAELPIPFFGLMAYELNHAPLHIARNHSFYHLPDFYIILPGEGEIINHALGQSTWLKFRNGLTYQPVPAPDTTEIPAPRFSENKTDYARKIETIRELIRDGEVYQTNYTARFSGNFAGSGFPFFQSLYAENPAPFSFYFHLPHCEIISNSPERFLSLSGRRALTEPIKGTIQRSDSPERDERLKAQLQHSQKDAAELSMIVDLLRNDLSRVCEPGSVKVREHMRLESFSNVHHLISSVEGRLAAEKNYMDLLRESFPGGSITGCPKIAAMNFIAQLELHERSFYTGAFFMRNAAADVFDSSILIRTAILKAGQIHFQAGGGIVIDSAPESEYNECQAKAASFLKVINKGRCDDLF